MTSSKIKDGECAEVIVKVMSAEVDRVFHYNVPDEMKAVLVPGCRCTVPFGGRSVEGFVIGFSASAVSADKIKSITSLPDAYPVLTPALLELSVWMKKKYYTTLAACLRCVAPSFSVRNSARKKRASAEEAEESPQNTQNTQNFTLTSEQQQAIETLAAAKPGKTWLIHGVTGSGKTEVYMRLIENTLREGKQAIMLVPEISLTPQAVDAFKRRFGHVVSVTHSRLTGSERAMQWRAAREGRCSVMIGPRSAVFTPFSDLGVIIVDEEHEKSYMSETSPKYAIAEVAEKLAEITGALLVLGSATPSVETYYRAKQGEIGLITMKKRVNERFPFVAVADLRLELAHGNKAIFSRALMDEMTENIRLGRQIILFMNRRGHSTFVSCRSCGNVLECEKCSVNFTYHIQTGHMLCHYCNAQEVPPSTCPVCESRHIRYFGAGTQKIEEEVRRLFPGVSILRMDMDSTKKRGGHEDIIRRFGAGKAQVLIGTQMIAKGLNFPNVSLVGIVDADVSLNMGDFRSAETCFQLITQVSGRAGRADIPGKVIIQTYNPNHYSIIFARENDYEGFYEHEIRIRHTMNYPPFGDVFMVMFTCNDEKRLLAALGELARVMRHYNRKGFFEILGPAPAMVRKVNNVFRWKILVKSTAETERREILLKFVFYCVERLKNGMDTGGININLTLNPKVLA